MSRTDGERIADIIDATNEITAVVALGKTAWDAERIARLAVERLLEVIGESARAMTEEARASFPGVAWPPTYVAPTTLGGATWPFLA